MRVYSSESGCDVTETARAEWRGGPEAFDAWSHQASVDLTRSVLRGPLDDEAERQLREHGWDPAVARRIAGERARAERELVGILNDSNDPRTARLRDVVTARYLANDLLGGRGHLKWPQCGRLKWPHLRPIGC